VNESLRTAGNWPVRRSFREGGFESHVAELEAAGEFAETVRFTSLAGHLEHDNPLVRQRALVEISRRDPTRALRHLIDLLGDDDLRVREEAVEILSRRSDAESLTELGNTLATRDIDAAARIAAFRAIAFRGEPASAEFVKLLTNDQESVIRDAAAQFLREMSLRMATQRK
jgi:HEAT repeat protein